MNKLIHGDNAIQTENVVYYTEVTLMKLVEIKIIVTIINELMNSFRKTNVSCEHLKLNCT